jgi:hypothetical protein
MPIYRAYKIINMYTTKEYEAPNEGQARAMALSDLGAVDKIEEVPEPLPEPDSDTPVT